MTKPQTQTRIQVKNTDATEPKTRADRPRATTKGESAHTPGPWKSSGITYGNLSEITVGSDEMDVATVLCIDISEQEAEANARLIAAAPELLAACKRVLDVITGDQAAELGIYTAIRSAEGRSNE